MRAKFYLPLVISHTGVVLLLLAVLADIPAVETMVELKPGEAVSSVNYRGTELPLGFTLQLVDFHEARLTSRIRLNSQAIRVVRPSHPVRCQGWLILQGEYESRIKAERLVLVTKQGETLRVVPGERVVLPAQGWELEFDTDIVLSRDTMFGFQVLKAGQPRVTGFISRAGVVPPSLRTGLRLTDYSLTAETSVRLQLIKRPGSDWAFAAFGVILAGILLTIIAGSGPTRRELWQ